MPKYVIERQYLVPMYQHIVVEAETFEAACDMAVSDDISWDSQEMDCDNARPTTLTAAKAISDGYALDPAQHLLIAGSDPIGISLAPFLYDDAVVTGPMLEIPARFTDGA